MQIHQLPDIQTNHEVSDMTMTNTHTQQLAGIIQIIYLETKEGLVQFECRMNRRNGWEFAGQISVREDEVLVAKYTIAESGFLGTAFKMAWAKYNTGDMEMLTDDQIIGYLGRGYSRALERADAGQRERVFRKLDDRSAETAKRRKNENLKYDEVREAAFHGYGSAHIGGPRFRENQGSFVTGHRFN